MKCAPWLLLLALSLSPHLSACGGQGEGAPPVEGHHDDEKEKNSKQGDDFKPVPPDSPVLTEPSPPSAKPPALNPKLLALTWVGGQGDQHLRSVAFEGEGEEAVVVAQGRGFEVRYRVAGGAPEVSGEPSTQDEQDYSPRPSPPGKPGEAHLDARSGLTFRVGFRQAGKVQMPIFRAFEGEERLWSLWGHAVADVIDKGLGADSRCYQAWAMPDGRLGVQCWTDGGNSVLAKDPRDLDRGSSWSEDTYMESAGGMASLYALIDPKEGGQVLSGTFIARHVSVLAADPWGRVVVADLAARRHGDDARSNPFGQPEDARAGFFVLDAELRAPIANILLGGSCQGGSERFGAIALQDGVLALAGTTCAKDLKTVNAAQPNAGGGQDGFLAVVRLW